MSESSPGHVPVAGRRSVDGRTRLGVQTQTDAEPLGEVFARIWLALDPLYRSFPDDGLLLVAVLHGHEVEAYLHVGLDDPGTEVPEFVVVGRHSACDLRLGRDDSISLRHMVISAHRRGNELRVRLLDLGTDAGMVTEDGQRCLSLGADGAAFVGLGPYQLFALPTGALAPLPWGATAADTWAAIPERVYLDRRAAGASLDRAPRVRLVGRGDRRSIATLILDPPTALRAHRLAPGARGPRAGRLRLCVGPASESYDVHAADLERGLLVGRYDRCAFGAEDDRLSRVHLLLVRDGDACWAVDTASSNGTTVAGVRIRQQRLVAEIDLCLARTITLLWTSAVENEGAAKIAPGPEVDVPDLPDP
jgi:hypothetical protein